MLVHITFIFLFYSTQFLITKLGGARATSMAQSSEVMNAGMPCFYFHFCTTQFLIIISLCRDSSFPAEGDGETAGGAGLTDADAAPPHDQA
jgi:hypothetical protein